MLFFKKCTWKETIDKMKRQTTELEIIFTNDVSDKGLNIQNIKIPYTA